MVHEMLQITPYFYGVIILKNNMELLSSVLKTTQMGQIGIRAVKNYAIGADLKTELKSQLKEYDTIEQEAHAIANLRGWEPKELDPAVKAMAKACTRASLMGSRKDSRIAAMMIHGNTMGMIKTIKNQHHCTQKHDARIDQLTQKLLDCERANIQSMQRYL